jgi:hypothetical protein
MEFAWSVLQTDPNIDPTRLSVIGHSVGAIEGVILGLRNADISAVIALDGTYGFQGLSSVLTHSYGYAPEKMRAAFLDLRRAQGAQGNEPLDLSAVESFRHSDRTLITIEKMHHSDFTSFAMIGAQFYAPLPTSYPLNGWNRETGRAGYEEACKFVLSFLDAKVKSDSNALGEIDRLARQNGGISLRHSGAVPPPPSPLEAAALANTNGVEAARHAFITSCGEGNLASCMDESRFNTWGYNLLGQQRQGDALVLFQLNAWAHPQSANAQDSLADGYLSVHDKENAKTAVQRAIALAPSDQMLDGVFGWFTDITAQSDFSGTFMSAVRFMAFADRSCSLGQDVLEISRFSCMLFLSVRGFSDYAGPDNPLARSVVVVLPSSLRNGSASCSIGFSKLNSPAHRYLCLRFKRHLAMSPARLKARMDSLLSFPVGLFHPLQHAGLSQRSPSSRHSGSNGAASASYMSGQVQMKDAAKSMVESPPLWQRVFPPVIIRWATRTQSTSA